jgi:hypothetical protein
MRKLETRANLRVKIMESLLLSSNVPINYLFWNEQESMAKTGSRWPQIFHSTPQQHDA